MNYKKIIKSRNVRMKILRMLSLVPDKTMLKMQYRIKTGRRLDLENPKRFTEKLQWYKLNYKNPDMVRCVDKYDVRAYVESKGLSNILIPCFGVYDCVDDIAWTSLPQSFVLKSTLGGGGTAVEFVRSKDTADIEKLKYKCKQWLGEDTHKRSGGREWPYYEGKNNRVIIEQYIDADDHNGGLVDYKFFCFNGRAEFIYVIADRNLGDKVGLAVYDRNYNKLEVKRCDENSLKREILKPSNFDEMLAVAEKLTEDFPHVRVDLYSQDNKTLFGEMTFFDGSGYMKFEPDEFDLILGSKFTLPENGGGYCREVILLFVVHVNSNFREEVAA